MVNENWKRFTKQLEEHDKSQIEQCHQLFEKIGISFLDEKGQIKSTFNLLKELSEKYNILCGECNNEFD